MWKNPGPARFQQVAHRDEKLVNNPSRRAARGLVPLFHKIHTPYYYGSIEVCYIRLFAF